MKVCFKREGVPRSVYEDLRFQGVRIQPQKLRLVFLEAVVSAGSGIMLHRYGILVENIHI